MKKFLLIIMSFSLTLPAIAQHTANERHRVKHNQRSFSTETPGLNIPIPATARDNHPSYFTMQRIPGEKNLRVIMQQMDNYTYQDYDESTSSWVNSDLNEFTYNIYGNNTRDVYSTWNPMTELYEIVGKQEFTYMDGDLVEEIYYEWDAGENAYVQLYQWTYDYNGDGYMTIAYSYYWNGSFWDLAGKDERTYDDAGNMVLQILSWWDSFQSAWYIESRTENSYNVSGALIVSTTSTWDFLSSNWLNVYRDEYTYNGVGQMTSSLHFSWDEESSEWENSYSDEFTYDENMNMVMILEQEWDGIQWVNSYRAELTYNNDFTSNEILLPWIFMGEEDMLMHMLTSIVDFEYINQSFEMVGRGLFNYSEVNITGVPVHERSQALVYPQPASDMVTFSWNSNHSALELELYNLNGQSVLSRQLDNNTSVGIDHLKPGLYFYILAGNKQTVHTGKISIR